MWPITGVAAGFCGFMYYAAGVPRSQVFGPSLWRAKADGSRLALTFDDGPSESTPAFLDILAEYKTRATFFQIGANARRLPEIARRVANEGHEIGNHTEQHKRFYLCAAAEVAADIETGQRSLEEVHGRPPRLFRSPWGARWFGMYPALKRAGLRSVMWSLPGHDWEWRPEWVSAHVTARARSGDVVLLHDGDTTTPGDRRQGSAQALRTILESFAKRGVAAVTVSELFGLDPNA